MKLNACDWIAALFLLLVFAGCERDVPVSDKVPSIFPAHFPKPIYPLPASASEKKQAELGRKLFYERILSYDSSISCASCHIQSAGFSDPGITVSAGIYGRPGKRNSPSLANLAWNTSFMWDGGINHIEVMPLAPISDSLEMNLSLAEAIMRLQENSQYAVLFRDAFGTSPLSSQQLLVALARFMAGMISADADYDSYLEGNPGAFSEKEKSGLAVFRSHCASCHTEPMFTDYSFRHNGLAENLVDSGRQRVTQQAGDRGKFKVPSLRNVAVSAPYMHDGRFQNLEDVLAHYQHPQNAASADPQLADGILLSPSEKSDLLAFLHTLTDHRYLSTKSLGKPEN